MSPRHFPIVSTPLTLLAAASLHIGLLLAFGQDEAILTRGPYLQMRAARSIVVRWRTDLPVNSVIRCGTEVSNLNLVYADPELRTEHQLTLTNLQPETKYFYSVETSAGRLSGDDFDTFIPSGEDNYFRTAPPPGAVRPTRIWFVSDYGFFDDGESAVRDSYFSYAAQTRPADVWLTGGDNDQRTGMDEQEQESIFTMYAPLLRNLPIWPTLGNHDTYTLSTPGPYPFFDNFSLPTMGEAGGTPSGSEHYYSFDYGDIHFICLDSITPELSSSPDTPMLQWLREDLAETQCKWKIAYWHGPPYTKGSHDSDNAFDRSACMAQMRQNVLPIIEAHGVDLVLNGHSHVYERSSLLNGHYDFSWQFSPTNRVDAGDGREDGTGPYRQIQGRGTVYVVAAVGGCPFGFYWGRHPAHVVNIGTELGSCFIDVNSNRLDFKFINSAANVLDHFTLIKAPENKLRIAGVTRAGDVIRLSWNSKSGELYRIYAQPELGANWLLIADRVPSQGLNTQWSGACRTTVKMEYFLISTCPP